MKVFISAALRANAIFTSACSGLALIALLLFASQNRNHWMYLIG
jgi:hypothetical protein